MESCTKWTTDFKSARDPLLTLFLWLQCIVNALRRYLFLISENADIFNIAISQSIMVLAFFLLFEAERHSFGCLCVGDNVDAWWAIPSSLKLESPSTKMLTCLRQRSVTWNGVCIVDACTELLMASSNIGKHSLQFEKSLTAKSIDTDSQYYARTDRCCNGVRMNN